MSYLESLSTGEIVRALPAYVGHTGSSSLGCDGCGGRCGGRCPPRQERLGASPAELVELARAAAARGATALGWLASQPGQVASGASAWARGELLAAQASFLEGWRSAVQAGMTGAAEAFRILYSRAGDALASLGQDAGEAFRSFWGLSPAQLGFGAVGLAALVWLLAIYSPGARVAIGAVGQGTGGALRELPRVIPRLVL